jgi:hypothetical protein
MVCGAGSRGAPHLAVADREAVVGTGARPPPQRVETLHWGLVAEVLSGTHDTGRSTSVTRCLHALAVPASVAYPLRRRHLSERRHPHGVPVAPVTAAGDYF